MPAESGIGPCTNTSNIVINHSAATVGIITLVIQVRLCMLHAACAGAGPSDAHHVLGVTGGAGAGSHDALRVLCSTGQAAVVSATATSTAGGRFLCPEM